jgi:hypothetical protein
MYQALMHKKSIATTDLGMDLDTYKTILSKPITRRFVTANTLLQRHKW